MGKIFHRTLSSGLYQLTSSDFGDSFAPGPASRSSYLVVGNDRAALVDLALEEPELMDYAAALGKKPIVPVLTHGHIDHIYHLETQKEAWLHPADEALLREGAAFQPPVVPCPTLHFLQDGDTIDLGDRILDVFHIPGHTDGSILLLDRWSRTLLSGDTVARRLLYGLHTPVPLCEFCASLRKLEGLSFDAIYSAHDRCALPKSHIPYMIEMLDQKLPYRHHTKDLPGIGQAVTFTDGLETDLRYFDVAILP